ncbi:MAG TPA: ABC transporter permease [Pyrinomonadaceae bacterium]|jgi:predicted permease|nr:ABC transporter permease [Pyrinomonadaceae bacterium]
MGSLFKDVRYGVRSMSRQPGFALAAVLTLALGIGANVSIFSAVNAILFRPLPGVSAPEELAFFYPTEPQGRLSGTFSYHDFEEYRAQAKSLSGLAAYAGAGLSMREGGRAERVAAQIVSGNYFSTLGVRAGLGRTLIAEEDERADAAPVAVLSHGFWETRFGSNPDVIGRQIVLNERSFTVVGVAQKEFKGASMPKSPALWVPVRAASNAGVSAVDLENREASWLHLIGRLGPGVSAERARAEMNTILARLKDSYPEDFREGLTMDSSPARGFAIAPRKRGTVNAMAAVALAVVGLVLLIACANIANLLLARAASRRREIAVRLALGAGRWRVVRQLLTESLVLALAGGLVASLLTLWTAELLAHLFRLIPEDTGALDFSPDARVFGFALLLSLLTGVAFGLAPALQASRPDVGPALKGETPPAGGARRLSLRNALVVAQVAASLVLLVCAGLFLRSLRETAAVETGFETKGVLMSALRLDPNRYDAARGGEFYRQALERASSLHGVTSAALASSVPLGSEGSRGTLLVVGAEPQPYAGVEVDRGYVGPRYFETLGIPLLRGRGFDEHDRENSPPVAVVNETVARKVFGGEDPLGRFIRADSEGPPVEIVGVARDSKYRSLGDERVPFLYLPLAQGYSPSVTLLVRTEGAPGALAPAVRDAVVSLDAEAFAGQATMDEHLAEALVPSQVVAGMSGGFGLLALLLATFGVYGVTAYAVSRRTHEIGVRVALGARGSDILRLVVGEGMALILTGIAIGLCVSFAATRVIAGALYGVSATDPLTFAGVTLLLASAALLACLVPARRATKVDPMEALRYE